MLYRFPVSLFERGMFVDREEYLFMKKSLSKLNESFLETDDSTEERFENIFDPDDIPEEEIEESNRIKAKIESEGIENLTDEEGVFYYGEDCFLKGTTMLNPRNYERWKKLYSCAKELKDFLIENIEIRYDGPNRKLRRSALTLVIRNNFMLNICFISDAKELIIKMIKAADRFIVFTKDDESLELEFSIDDIWTNGTRRRTLKEILDAFPEE